MMFENTLRYNSNGETTVIKETAEYVDSLLIPAHFVIDDPRKIAGLIDNLDRKYDLNFYVDPRLPTYRIGDNFRDEVGDLREWDQFLVNYYGKPVSSILLRKGNLTVSDLDSEELRKVIHRQCDLQVDLITDSGQSKLERYGVGADSLKPKAVIPWYVKIESPDDLESNRRIIEIAKDYCDLPIKPCLFVTNEFLSDSSTRNLLLELVSDIGVDEVFLWPASLEKRERGVMHYAAVAETIYEISQQDIDPHLLYGSYLEHALAYLGNTGSGFGPGYQESRDEKLENADGGGGGGLNRYYYRPTKTFLNFQETETLGEKFGEPLCDCSICDSLLSGWQDIYKFDGDRNTQSHHYVASRAMQSEELKDNGLQDVLHDLGESHSKYRDSLGDSDTAAQPYHLNMWKAGIKHFVERVLDEEVASFETLPK
ncbi:hypothetical protein E4P24_18845 [Haloferax sp. AS1]|uniref:hypothetical protein n=1 Tax=Haloferax sp. AS1 TaxID=2562277 RepID=UPI00165FB0C9|nr:hypothetical protein [Haloferax sp. AS1]MBC9988404.1 hypothetical protein [Haloferax sp. AS1]